VPGASPAAQSAADRAPPFNLFGFLLPGLASMFLLFLGNTAMNDLRREFQQRTLARIRTVRHRLEEWVASKVAFSGVMLLLSAAIMLGGGGAVFAIDWRAPLAVLALSVAYCLFAAGLTALLGALMIRQERADAFATVTLMGVGLAGGGAFPAQQLPGLIRDHLSPWLPNFWFIETVRGLTVGHPDVAWGLVALKTAGLGAGLAFLAAWWLKRRLERSGPA
jgi:ABC-type multidrug transport system permease subunit